MMAPNHHTTRQLRIDLAAAFRWAVRHGLHEGICNHFSAALGPSRLLINPIGLHWSEITASSLLEVDLAGNLHAGTGAVEPTAFYIHSRIHKAHPHAGVVMHTHMPYATALTLCEGGRLEPCEQKALRFWSCIAYDNNYNGLVFDTAEGDRIAQCLGDNRVLFLASHGVIVTNRTVAEAYDDLYYLERACQVQVLARQTGLPLRRIPEAVIAKTAKQSTESGAESAALHFAALKRILEREAPQYAD